MPKISFDFNGILKLLAQNLYNEKDVFVREMIQNSHDALKKIELDKPSHNGRIEIKIDYLRNELIFNDDGIGMNETDLIDYLSKVGASPKKEGENDETIGEFGIGFLSGFNIADRIQVYTKKYGTEQGYKWENEGSQDYTIEVSSFQQDVGTTVVLHVKKEYDEYLNEEKIKSIIKKYADFIPYPIFLIGKTTLDRKIPINKINAPWHEAMWGIDDFETQIDNLLKERFPYDYPLLVIPVHILEPLTTGVLYVASDDIPGINTAGFLDIFIKRMCIQKNEREILPTWAKFVKGIIDTSELTPTASRDNIIKDSQYYKLQKQLGVLIVNSLIELAKNNQKRFESLCQFHEYTLKGMALQYEDLFDTIIELLPFDTNIGLLNLQTFRKANGYPLEIKYFQGQKNSFHFYDIANASKEIVFNCGHAFEKELLFKYARKLPDDIKLVDLTTNDNADIYKKLAQNEERKYADLIRELGFLLRKNSNNVQIEIRSFEPAEMSGIIINHELLEAERKLKNLIDGDGYILSGITELAKEQKEKLSNQPLRFFINANNRIIQELSTVDNLSDDNYAPLLFGLFNSSFINSNQLNEHNLKVIYTQFQDRLYDGIKLLQQLKQALKEKSSLEESAKRFTVQQEVPTYPYTQIFLMISYKPEYIEIEKIIKRILQNPPFYFKVLLAKDELRTQEMKTNIQKVMIESDGYVGEITEPSLNVYLEVGWTFFDPDMENRPRILICKEEFNPPTDIRGLVFAKYDEKLGNDQIETKLKEEFAKGFKALLKRRNERYLSPMLFSKFKFLNDSKTIDTICEKYFTIESLTNTTTEELIKHTGDISLGHLLPLIKTYFNDNYSL